MSRSTVDFWLRRLLCAGAAFALVPFGRALAATTRAIDAKTYARSETLADFVKLAALVKNPFLVPHWIGTSDSFWYKRDLGAGEHEFTIVDAATGAKHPAFDSSRMAAVLSKASGKPVSATALDLVALGDGANGPTLTFSVGGVAYVCSGDACTRQPAVAPSDGVVSPDGTHAAFTRDGNLWIRDLHASTERALTKDGKSPDYGYGVAPGGSAIVRVKYAPLGYVPPPFGVSWAPDSKTVLVTLVDQRDVANYPFVETVPGDGSFRPVLYLDRIPLMGEKNPVLRYFAIDAATGVEREVKIPDGLQISDLAKPWWGADGTRFALASTSDLSTAALLAISPDAQAVRVVVQERLTPRADLNTTYYNPPNIYVTKDEKEAIWFSQRDGYGHLYLYDVAIGRMENQITKGDWVVRDIVHVDEAHRIIYFTASGREPGNPYYRYLYRVNFDGSGMALLSPEPADHLIVGSAFHFFPFEDARMYTALSPSGKYCVYTYSTPSQAPQSVVRRTTDGSLVATLEKADVSALYAAGYRSPREFAVKAADKVTDLYGVIYEPEHVDEKRLYPIIDSEYTSPLIATTPRDFMSAIIGPPAQLTPSSLNALGFVVVGIDGRGTPGRSKAFLDYSYGGDRWKTMGLEDHVAAIEQLHRRYPYIDLARVGIVGWSFGGEAATRGLLEFPDFFKVGVAADPAGGQHNMYTGTEPWIGVPEYSDGTSLRPKPNEVPKNYAPFDSAQQAQRLQGHLLILVGELDQNVFAASTLQFTDALMKAHKDFDLIYSPNAAHFETYATFPSYGDYLRRRMRDYFITKLLGATLPAQPAEWLPQR